MAKEIRINVVNMYFKEVEGKKIKDTDPEIIAWERVDRGPLDTPLTYSFPQQGDNIKKKKYFAVKDYQKALFYDKGQLIGVLGGGVYELSKKARIKGTELVWLDASLLDIPWGIPQTQGIPTKDGYIVGIHGDLKLKISDAKTFYNDVVAGKTDWTNRHLRYWIISLLHTSLRDIFKSYEAKNIILEDRERVINLITSKITEEMLVYGLELETFNVIGINTPEGAEELFQEDKRKAKVISENSKRKVESLIRDKNEVQKRIKELKDKLKAQQDLLLDSKITQQEYEEKKGMIEKFISESQDDLNEIEKKIDSM